MPSKYVKDHDSWHETVLLLESAVAAEADIVTPTEPSNVSLPAGMTREELIALILQLLAARGVTL
jgi:hypothetical protein